MKELFILIAHLLTTLVSLAQPGGVRSVVAQSLALRHQLLVLQRRRKRAPQLAPWDRLFFGLCSLWLAPKRRTKVSIVLRPSTPDHDPLFRFHRWLANLRVLDIREVKSVPYVPVSHPFVERMIRTIREELLDQVLFWNQLDLERKLSAFRIYYNRHPAHSGINGIPPQHEQGQGHHQKLRLTEFHWASHCHGLFQLPAAA